MTNPPTVHTDSIERDKFSWLRDDEFSRQTLAGLNPLSIQLPKEFPIGSKLDPEIYGPAESKITKELIEREMKARITLEEALKKKRLFILDYHDVLLPYVHRVREIEGMTLYGSQTIFFLTDDDFCTRTSGTQWRSTPSRVRASSPPTASSRRPSPHGKYSVELSSAAYAAFWRFDIEALPADLIRRGMAVEDPEAEHGLRLTIEDYPYANDGLLLWSAIADWVEAYVRRYYHHLAKQVMAVLDVLSCHSPDEEYLGERAWAEDGVVREAFERFNGRLKEIERIIDERNGDVRLKNRTGGRGCAL
ncbi:hypothetical protein QJS04_geneDACA010371 [Acorus gramineus]|uniref:Lipoxygenase domain-containing protein n=1 Tax=Acorus gramineus TaxID=55184 RepID=A0AAV9A554_ACOGR|nr:hypothetical protein QJS04_geneDACA010371 [Acorus gramineus]